MTKNFNQKTSVNHFSSSIKYLNQRNSLKFSTMMMIMIKKKMKMMMILFIYVNSFNFLINNNVFIAADAAATPGAAKIYKTPPLLTWKKNLNYQQTIDFMKQLEKDHPKVLKLISIGKSVKDKDLLVMRISTEPRHAQLLDSKENLYEYYEESRTLLRPSIKIISTIHGNEPLGKQLLLALAEYLLIGYKNGDERIVKMLNSTNIELLPIMNPDGFEVSIEGQCSGIHSPKHRWNGYTNANQIDLANDFSISFDQNDNDKRIEPETLAVMTWIVTNPSFVLSASIHTGMKVISYPFDGIKNTTLDHELFKSLAKNYVINLKDSKSFLNGCSLGDKFSDGISIGHSIEQSNDILMNKSMADFNYINTNCLEIDLHLSCCKYPNSSIIEPEWENNRESLLKYIESSHWGIKGLITDFNTQSAIKAAVISIKDYGHNITSSNRGEYWRILLPGVYYVTVTAFGYEPQTKVITITNNNSTSALVMNFTLHSTLAEKPNSDSIEKEDEKNVLPDFHTPAQFVHHNYKSMTKFLRELNTKYPNITRLYSIGQTVENRELWVLEITDNPGEHEIMEPEFKFVANMHGNEVAGREMILLFAKLLLENYGHHNEIDWLINNTRIHLMPSMNPDGYERSKLGDCDSLHGRGNANNVDLNRNFPDQYRTYSENRIQEKETINVMRWLKSYPFVLSANLHGGALVANYPFDGSNSTTDEDSYNGTPDDKLFRHLASVYSQNHPHMHKGKCHKICADNELSREHYKDGIINGAYWYSLYGGMQDWNYLNTNCFEITVELGCQKYPLAKELPRLWQENRRPMLMFVKEVHRGIKGVIRDAYSNNSIVDAEIHVNGSSHFVRSVAPYGDYWRLLLPGIYEVTIIKNGYQSNSQIVLVKNGSALQLDFLLKPKMAFGMHDSNGNSTNSFVIFTMTVLILFSILFFAFCMSIVWCPGILFMLLNRIKLFNFCMECDVPKFFQPTSTKPKTFIYSPLNQEDELLRDLSDDEICLK